MLGSHAVKVKFADSKVWHFATPKGGANRLRIHAATFTPERADEVKALIEKDAEANGIAAVKVVEL